MTSKSEHYDVVIIGSGPGGGTMAWRLAQTGKRILLLERGDYLPRERENWDSQGRIRGCALSSNGDLVQLGRQELSPRPALFRGRQQQSLWRRPATAPRAGLR